MMAEMFVSPSRPFYQSTSMMSLAPINIDHYIEFAQGLFREYGKDIEQETIREVYQRYEGVTWYVQTILNTLFTITEPGGKCQNLSRLLERPKALQERIFTHLFEQAEIARSVFAKSLISKDSRSLLGRSRASGS